MKYDKIFIQRLNKLCNKHNIVVWYNKSNIVLKNNGVWKMNNVFNTKRKPLTRATTDKFKPYRAVKHFKHCVLCSKQIDSTYKESVCLSCGDSLTIAQIEQDQKPRVEQQINNIWSVA